MDIINDRKTLLIVDDQSINRKILANIIKSKYDYLEASNGITALKLIETTESSISLVLLDLIMPEMDGYELLKELRNMPLYAHTPIIVITSGNGLNIEKKVFKMGATDFISKPYNSEIVKMKIDTLLELQDSISNSPLIKRDMLTHLFTEDAFYSEGNKIISSLRSRSWSVISINIANLTSINNLCGYTEGDNLLQTLAAYLKDLAHPYGGIIGRTWRNCYSILLPDVKNIYQLTDEITDMKKFLKNYDIDLYISLKIGFAAASSSTDTLRVVCDNTFIAIKSIANSYYSTIRIYDKRFDEKLRTRIQLTEEMHNALATKQFVVYLQSKINMETGVIIGAEALVRWEHPDKGLLPPDTFIPIFEENGFITDLDAYVFSETCKILQKIKKHKHKAFPVSVNVSRLDLYNKAFINTITAYTTEYGIEPDLIHIEITETAYIDDISFITKKIQELRNFGFRIEMDDFGSKYSSLTMLTKMPFDIIKLDAQFLFNRKNNPEQEMLFKFINILSVELKKPIIVEGVETQSDVDFLLKNNFKYAQGYHYSKPIPYADFVTYYENQQPKAISLAAKAVTYNPYIAAWLNTVRYSNFIDNIPFAYFIFNDECCIKSINERAYKFLSSDLVTSYKNNVTVKIENMLTKDSYTRLLLNKSNTLKKDTAPVLFYPEFIIDHDSILVVPSYLFAFEVLGKTNWMLLLIEDLTAEKAT